MPRYRFDLADGCHLYRDDEEGVRLRDLEAARRYAIQDIRGLVSHRPEEDWTGWRIEITDLSRRTLLIVTFSEALLHDAGPGGSKRSVG